VKSIKIIRESPQRGQESKGCNSKTRPKFEYYNIYKYNEILFN
jgi:hypothetical protein